MKRHSPFNLFVIGLATAAITVLQLIGVQRQVSTRYLVVLLEVALGLPCLVLLAARQPVAVPEPVEAVVQGRSRTRTQTEAAPPHTLSNPRRTQIAARVALGFVSVAVLSALFSGRAGLSIFGQHDWANGALLATALVAMWSIGIGFGQNSSKLFEQCLLGAILANAGIALVQGATGLGLIAERAPGMLDNPVYLAPLLVGGMWLAIGRIPSSPIVWGAALSLLAAAVQTSGSRSALLLFPILLAGTARLHPKRIVGISVLCLLVGLVVGGLAASVGEDSTSSTTRTVNSVNGDTFTTRLEVWSMASHAIRDRPFLGAGPGRFLDATGKYTTLKLTKAEGLDSQFADAHNILVEYAVTTGLLGVLLLISFLAFALRLSGWGSPLAGFAILALAIHLVEPQVAFVTPVVFLALGAAATGERALSWEHAAIARVVLVVIACEQALLITFGERTIFDTNGQVQMNTVAARYDALDRATWQTPFWGEAFSRQADLDEARAASGDPTAEQDAVRNRRKATEREPEQLRYWALLAVTEQKAGDVAAAKAAFQQALSVNPWAADVQLVYARLLIDQGDTAEARRQIEHAALALPDRREADQLLNELG